jgi:hypothetical protein
VRAEELRDLILAIHERGYRRIGELVLAVEEVAPPKLNGLHVYPAVLEIIHSGTFDIGEQGLTPTTELFASEGLIESRRRRTAR